MLQMAGYIESRVRSPGIPIDYRLRAQAGLSSMYNIFKEQQNVKIHQRIPSISRESDAPMR